MADACSSVLPSDLRSCGGRGCRRRCLENVFRAGSYSGCQGCRISIARGARGVAIARSRVCWPIRPSFTCGCCGFCFRTWRVGMLSVASGTRITERSAAASVPCGPSSITYGLIRTNTSTTPKGKKESGLCSGGGCDRILVSTRRNAREKSPDPFSLLFQVFVPENREIGGCDASGVRSQRG
jgi:hypothetical protein